VEPINFVMEQKMLRTIKQRAEALVTFRDSLAADA